MSMCVMRGCESFSTCISRPSTPPLCFSSRSSSSLSRTSRTRFTSASDDLERNRDHRQNKRNQHDDRDNSIADPAIAVLPEIDGIVHEEKEWDNRQRQSC